MRIHTTALARLFFLVALLGTQSPCAFASGEALAPDIQIDVPQGITPWRGGYLVGNGRMYGVVALGAGLTREWKSDVADPAPLSQIAWMVGPHYGNANLGFGWEVLPEIGGQQEAWTREGILRPEPDLPFWGVYAETPQLRLELRDVLHPEETVWLRRAVLTAGASGAGNPLTLRIPVSADPRNAAKDDEAWGEKERQGHVPAEAMLRVDAEEGTILLQGAQRRLYTEWTSQPMCQVMDHPARFLATAITAEGGDAQIAVDESGFRVELGEMQPGQQKVLNLWLVTGGSAASTRQLLSAWRSRSGTKVVAECRRRSPEPLFTRTDGQSDPILEMLQGCTAVCEAAQARCGGVLASPYMYPMCYVRDQFGSFRLFLELGAYERAWRALAYHVAMQNHWGLQNSYEAVPDLPDPNNWSQTHPAEPGQGHGGAEVPAYIILMARDYYLATGDLARVAPLYARLAYNLRVHNFDAETHLLASPTDESYTQIVGIGGEKDFTDSNILFLGAADFMVRLARELGHEADAVEFQSLRDRTFAAMKQHLWVEEGRYFAICKQDRRPCFDPSLRWFHLGIGDRFDPIQQGCLDAVLRNLINPIRVVPDRPETAGMAPGYLLQALSRAQRPQIHDAARLLTLYGSDTHNMNEFYHHGPDAMSGKLRPWESGVAGWAIAQYLLGAQPDLPAGKLRLQPHLPPGWPGWGSRPLELPGQGVLQYRLERQSDGSIEFAVTRRGGRNPLEVEVEFGGFGNALAPLSPELAVVAGRSKLLAGAFTLTPMDDKQEQTVTLRFAAP